MLNTITTTYNTGMFEFTIEMTVEEAIAGLNECIEDATEFNDTRMANAAKAQLAELINEGIAA